jgi:hypothetical protein
MIAAAISQPTAIQRPPKTIHRRLRSRDKGDMSALRSLAILCRRQRVTVS